MDFESESTPNNSLFLEQNRLVINFIKLIYYRRSFIIRDTIEVSRIWIQTLISWSQSPDQGIFQRSLIFPCL